MQYAVTEADPEHLLAVERWLCTEILTLSDHAAEVALAMTLSLIHRILHGGHIPWVMAQQLLDDSLRRAKLNGDGCCPGIVGGCVMLAVIPNKRRSLFAAMLLSREENCCVDDSTEVLISLPLLLRKCRC